LHIDGSQHRWFCDDRWYDLLVIMDESALVVHMQVPLANVGQVRSGEQAQITPSALTDHVFPGVVSAMIPQANPQTATFEVRVSINDPQHLLLPGMTVFVRIQIATTALLVPRLAVLLLDQLANNGSGDGDVRAGEFGRVPSVTTPMHM